MVKLSDSAILEVDERHDESSIQEFKEEFVKAGYNFEVIDRSMESIPVRARLTMSLFGSNILTWVTEGKGQARFTSMDDGRSVFIENFGK